jgi:CRISPR-associated protein Cmr2
VKSPLQDVVRAAQAAEKRAKQNLGRAAVAVTLVKRSGEIIEWGCQWESRGLALIKLITDAMEKEQLSGKFPHRVVELLNPYLLSQSDIHQMEAVPGFDPAAVVRREVRHALTRQSRKDHSTIAPPIEEALGDYLKAIGSRPEPIRDVIGLCQTVAFIQRQ